MNCSDHLEDNNGPIGALFHGISTLYCMTTSLAQRGAGLGTLGLHEHVCGSTGRWPGSARFAWHARIRSTSCMSCAEPEETSMPVVFGESINSYSLFRFGAA
jgi:hypothetical protein